MTKQDILEYFNDINDAYNNPNKHDDLSKMLDMLVPQEPCGKDINVPATDAISRQAVLDGVDRYIYKSQSTGTQDDFYSFAELVVKQLPSVTPQPKTGHWIEKDGFDGDVYYDCSECGESWTTIEGTPWDNVWNYCPSCGARMVEPQESEE